MLVLLISSALLIGLFTGAFATSGTDDGIVSTDIAVVDQVDALTSFPSAELKVQASGNKANAAPGGTGNANILVLVTYKGGGVTSLNQSDFRLITHLVPPGKGAVSIKEFHNKGNGAYTFQVVPISGVTWGSGQYDIQVIAKVTTSTGKTAEGQAIATIIV
ncbi:MAG: hypothetical protein ACE5J3_02965 [Methanosarcinales archaeon]